jgi:hypothetical protein
VTPRSTFQHHESFELRVLAALAAGATTPNEIAAGLTDSPERVRAALTWAVDAGAVTRLDLPEGDSYSLTSQGLHGVALTQGIDAAVSPRGHVDLGAATRLVAEQYDAARDVATEDAVRQQADWVPDDAARDRVTSALGDAFARGALTKEQLDDRTGRALTATTMGDLRAAAEGVLELPPALPTGLGPISGGLQASRVETNPALAKVRWRHVAYAATYLLVGVLILVLVHSVVGVAAILAGLGLGAWTLRPLFASARTTRL